VGPIPYGFTWGLVLLKDLPKTTNTVRYFHAPNQNGKMDHDENNRVRNNGFSWVQLLWDYMVVKASLRSYIVHHDQSGLSRPNHKGKNGEKMTIFTI
jgi:hypothetical protein